MRFLSIFKTAERGTPCSEQEMAVMGKLIEDAPTSLMFTAPTQKQTEDYITGRFG